MKPSEPQRDPDVRVLSIPSCSLLTCVPLQMVSRELEKECMVVFDEAHNIDNVCIEALSVNLRQQTLEAAGRNLGRLNAVRRTG